MEKGGGGRGLDQRVSSLYRQLPRSGAGSLLLLPSPH